MTKDMQTLALAPLVTWNRTSGLLTLGRCYRLMKSGSLLKSCITRAIWKQRKKLILSHLRFVVHIARNYSGGLPQADLIQEGNIGLMKAVRRFNRKWACVWFPSPSLDQSGNS